MRIVKSRHIAALLLATLLAGCKPDAALHHAETIDQSNGAQTLRAPVGGSHTLIDPTTFGSIKGTVHFTGAAPARVKIDMSMDPACSLAKGDNLSEQYVVSGNKLANVFLYIKSGIAPSMAPEDAPTVILDQKGCRYTPHVIAIQQGGYVAFHNSDPTMHNVHITPPDGSQASSNSVDVSQGPMGAPQSQQFNTPELMLPVRCNNHPWMNAFINVAPTPYFAVSAADGSFTIPNLPPGTNTLAAVHEKLGEQDVQVTVPAKSTAKEDFTFTAK